MSSFEKFFAVCNWFTDHGAHLVADTDGDAFAALNPAGKVFQCVGEEGGWLVVRYGANTYRVNPEIMKLIPAPIFQIGQIVSTNGKCATVAEITWHHKDAAPIYFLDFGKKRSSRRYSEAELAPFD